MDFDKWFINYFSCRSVIYKEHIRLNQAATNALTARLEAQKAICDAAEKELHKKYKQRDELEKEIRHEWEQGRKRSRIDDASTSEVRDSKPLLYMPGIRPRTSLHKELRVLLEEEQRESETGLYAGEEQKQEAKEEVLKITADNTTQEKLEEHNGSLVALEEENSIEHKLEKIEISEGKKDCGISFPVPRETEPEEDEESRKRRGKGNAEKWLQMLLENSHDDKDSQETNKNETTETGEIIKQVDKNYQQQELKISKVSDFKYKEKQLPLDEGNGIRSFEGVKRKEEHKKGKRLFRSESARALRRIPSSPSLLLGMRKGVDCIRKKSIVSGIDDGSGDLAAANRFFRSPIKTIKRAVKL